MPKELPFYVVGKIADILVNTAYVKISTGNVYHLTPNTPGIEFDKLRKGMMAECEVTTLLTRVLSARIIED